MHDPISDISNFIFLNDLPAKADIILVPGGSVPELMLKACELYKLGFAPLILPSGGYNKRIPNYKSEWNFFIDIAKQNNIPIDCILKEDKASNTFENAHFSWNVIVKSKLKISKALLVCKAHHSRRALLTYQTEFKEPIEYIVVPILDHRQIGKENWYLDTFKTEIVFKEIEKIGQYFGKHIGTLAAHS